MPNIRDLTEEEREKVWRDLSADAPLKKPMVFANELNRTKGMRSFRLLRLEDESGVSGTGIVAIGVQFPSGKCVMEWQTALSSIALYDSIDSVERIHGHGGKTLVEWTNHKEDARS